MLTMMQITIFAITLFAVAVVRIQPGLAVLESDDRPLASTNVESACLGPWSGVN